MERISLEESRSLSSGKCRSRERLNSGSGCCGAELQGPGDSLHQRPGLRIYFTSLMEVRKVKIYALCLFYWFPIFSDTYEHILVAVHLSMIQVHRSERLIVKGVLKREVVVESLPQD